MTILSALPIGSAAGHELDPAFPVHVGGKLAVSARLPIDGPDTLSLVYTPGVGRVSQAVAADPAAVWRYTGRSNAVAVLSNGTAVLGLGDIGPEAALPVMEGKAVLFKQFAGIDAYPVCVRARSIDEMVAIGTAIAPTFGGINLEDIAAPACFEIERRLQDAVDIPVVHDDQHGTAIVVLAALLNTCQVVGKELGDLSVVVVGTGAAGRACAELLHHAGVGSGAGDLLGVDRFGIVDGAYPDLHEGRQWFVDHGNHRRRRGDVAAALCGADVVIGVSGPGALSPDHLADMAPDAAVFALANPIPEVMPDEVPQNVAVVATGRSDFPNQINNVLAFPGLFRGLLDAGLRRCTMETKLAAARALAEMVPAPAPDRILPGAFEPGVAATVAAAVAAVGAGDGVGAAS
jgi:malate dehydrogenase (oxaloacetate-decarboxylating)